MTSTCGTWQTAGTTAANQRFARRRTLRAHPFRNPPSAIRTRGTRNAVTLVELLITIAILATISAVFLGASRSAMEFSRSSRTKATINKLDKLLMERWASYSTRRVDVPILAGTSGNAAAWARLDATRKLMMLEMPDRWSDLLGDTVENSPPINPPAIRGTIPIVEISRTAPPADDYGTLPLTYPSLTRAYLRRYDRLDPSDPEKIRENQSAECLYMIILLATGDGEARTLFSQQDIGDTDEDGAPEFLDGWGNPIGFIRWPSGFVAESDLMSGDADADHDPFDHFRRDNTAYRLVPLIFSIGADDDSDINTSGITVTSLTNPPDPYASNYDSAQLGVAQDRDDPPDGEGWHDNIHNHLQDR